MPLTPSRQPPRGSFEHDDPNPPDIGRRSQRPTVDLLGRHVPVRPHSRTGAARPSRHAEIENLSHPALGHDVRRLEVKMQPSMLVEISDRRTELLPEKGDIGYAQPLQTVHRVSERLPGERLQDHDRSPAS